MPRAVALVEETGDRGRVEAVDQAEIGVRLRPGEGVAVQGGLFQGAQNPGNSHQTSLDAASDTGGGSFSRVTPPTAGGEATPQRGRSRLRPRRYDGRSRPLLVQAIH